MTQRSFPPTETTCSLRLPLSKKHTERTPSACALNALNEAALPVAGYLRNVVHIWTHHDLSLLDPPILPLPYHVKGLDIAVQIYKVPAGCCTHRVDHDLDNSDYNSPLSYVAKGLYSTHIFFSGRMLYSIGQIMAYCR